MPAILVYLDTLRMGNTTFGVREVGLARWAGPAAFNRGIFSCTLVVSRGDVRKKGGERARLNT